MLNLTEKQLEDFEQWQTEAYDQVDMMQQTIKVAIPTEYSRNDFYLQLTEIKNEIGSLFVKKDVIHYKYEKITSEIKARSCLRKIADKFDTILFDTMFQRFKEIFEI